MPESYIKSKQFRTQLFFDNLAFFILFLYGYPMKKPNSDDSECGKLMDPPIEYRDRRTAGLP